MGKTKNTAGGRATEAGMEFQAAVATWFAAHMLADSQIGAQFGLARQVKVAGVQCETSDAMDDVVVRLHGGGSIYAQCKTRPTLASDSDSLLGKAIGQLVDLYVQHGPAALVKAPTAALLAVADNAPRSLDNLEEACRLFDLGGDWGSVNAQLPTQKASALALFRQHACTAWAKHHATSPSDLDLVAMARLFRIRRFGQDATHADWREATHMLGRKVFGNDVAGAAPMSALLGLCRKLIHTGAPADRNGLLRALRSSGHTDVAAPGYEADVAALVAYSKKERARLSKHTSLPLGDGIPIARECLAPLLAAVADGSLVVTGEPGAGKTGALLALADRLAQSPGPVLFFSVELFSGFSKRSDFRTELGLEHDPIEVLKAWPGDAPGTLIIDALDASRGGPSEQIIAAFMAEAIEMLGARWSLVTSIRSFDLRNGQRFRVLMPGAPPNPQFVDGGLNDVRHFRVPRLSEGELKTVLAMSSDLSQLNATAPKGLKELLSNVFNLSLAAELISSGVTTHSIQTVTTQSELIRRYEDIRLQTHGEQRAVKEAVTLMVQQRQMTVRAVDLESESIDAVRQSGVLVGAGDRVAFAHHVLFDHMAGRFYLAWNDVRALKQQVSGDQSLGLVLGPALRFALEQVWQEDDPKRPTTWRFLRDLLSETKTDSIVQSIALRTAVEQVAGPSDLGGLCSLVSSRPKEKATGALLSRLARFVAVAIGHGAAITSQRALAWAAVSQAAAAAGTPPAADAARVLLQCLADHIDLGKPDFLASYGMAARDLLAYAWTEDREYPILATTAICFVTQSFASDPAASRKLLERILGERFEDHASQEAPRLAEGVSSIIPCDSEFAEKIYATIFTRDVTDQGKTWLGGSASRILPLSSTHRQDYEHARWRLNQALRSFLESNVTAGTRAVVASVRGLHEDQSEDRRASTIHTIDIGGTAMKVVDDLLSLQDWRLDRTIQDEPLKVFADYLRSCDLSALRTAIRTLLGLEANAAVWARVLGVAADRTNEADDVLWPLARTPRFAALQGLARDAVIFITAAYPNQTTESRAAFENAALDERQFADGKESDWWHSVLGRFLSVVPVESLATSEMKARRKTMELAGELSGNPPLMTLTVGWGAGDNIVDELLRSDGADLEASPNRELREATRELEECVEAVSDQTNQQELASMWSAISGLKTALDEAADTASTILARLLACSPSISISACV